MNYYEQLADFISFVILLADILLSGQLLLLQLTNYRTSLTKKTRLTDLLLPFLLQIRGETIIIFNAE